MPEAFKEFNVDMLDPKAKDEDNMVRVCKKGCKELIIYFS